MSVWRKFTIGLAPLLVSSWLIQLQPLFFLTPVHLIHSYQGGFVDKFKLPTVALKTPMLVSSPGAESMSSRGCFQLPLTIGTHVFPTDLIILESQGLDIILGMDWLSR